MPQKYKRHHRNHDAWVDLYLSGMSARQIADDYGVTEGAVHYILRSRDVPHHEPAATRRHEESHAEWVRLYESGMHSNEIASLFHATPATVISALRKMGVKVRPATGAKRRYLVKNDHAFDAIDSWEKAYWLGFLIACGSIIDHGDARLPRVQISLNARDAEHIRTFAAFIGSDAPLYDVPKKNAVYYDAKSSALVAGLIRAGCTPRKALIARVPFDVVPENLLSGFVLGVFDGNGNVSKRRGATWSSRSLHLLLDIRQILSEQAGIEDAQVERSRPGSPVYRLSLQRNLERLSSWLYSGATVFLERKRHQLEHFK